VHIASVWVPFTSESKEAVAAYPEIQKELRLALQSAGRKLGMYLRRRNRVRQEGERRNTFLRYLGEVAGAVSEINGVDRQQLYDQLVKVAKKQTAEADVRYDDRGDRIEDEHAFGQNVLIVQPEDQLAGINRVAKNPDDADASDSGSSDSGSSDSGSSDSGSSDSGSSELEAKPAVKAQPKVRAKPKASTRPRRPKAKRSSR